MNLTPNQQPAEAPGRIRTHGGKPITPSPLPWKRGSDGLVYDANSEYVTDTCGTSLPNGVENQRLIVLAVNSHADLLAACRQVIQVVEQLPLDSPLIDEGHAAAKNARAAIAAVERRTPKS